MKAKEDDSASIIIRAILLICAYLECRLHAEHQPRMSDWGSEVSDRLSRRATTTKNDRRLVQNWDRHSKIPPCLIEWLSNPGPDWNLARNILDFVIFSS